MSACRNQRNQRSRCHSGENPHRNFFEAITKAEMKRVKARYPNSVNSTKPGAREILPPTTYIPGPAGFATGLVMRGTPYSRNERRILRNGGQLSPER